MIFPNQHSEDDKTRCDVCGKTQFILDKQRGDTVCSSCGIVLEEKMPIHEPHTRNKYNIPKMDLQYIHNSGIRNNLVNQDQSIKYKKIVKWNNQTYYTKTSEKNYKYVLSVIHIFSSQIQIPRVVRDTAVLIYTTGVKRRLIRRKSRRGIAIASIYIAMRQRRIPIDIKKIESITGFNCKKILRYYRELIHLMKLKVPIDDPINYLPSVISKLGLAVVIQRTAHNIIRKMKDLKVAMGKDATGIAGAAIYVACILNSNKISQQLVSQQLSISTITIRRRSKEMAKFEDRLILINRQIRLKSDIM